MDTESARSFKNDLFYLYKYTLLNVIYYKYNTRNGEKINLCDFKLAWRAVGQSVLYLMLIYGLSLSAWLGECTVLSTVYVNKIELKTLF